MGPKFWGWGGVGDRSGGDRVGIETEAMGTGLGMGIVFTGMIADGVQFQTSISNQFGLHAFYIFLENG